MYESFGLAGIQFVEKYKENFDVWSEGPSTCTVRVCVQLFQLRLSTSKAEKSNTSATKGCWEPL
jgi:hypothetical protein